MSTDTQSWADDVVGGLSQTYPRTSYAEDPYEITARSTSACPECTQRMLRSNAEVIPNLGRVL